MSAGGSHPYAGAAGQPHDCSIACDYARCSLDEVSVAQPDLSRGDLDGPHSCADPPVDIVSTGLTEDRFTGRRVCPGCQRYFEPVGQRRHCSAACRVAEWRRHQPTAPAETTTKTIAAIEEVTAEHAPIRYVDDASAAVIDQAVKSLGGLRGLRWVGDAAAVLHVLSSLAAQIDTLLPAAITDARDQCYSWSEIAALLGITRQRAQRLAAQHKRAPLAD